ncbi:MAG: hypothetical protein IKV43_05085, partial [Clostridia bacterium]|nr:hypothetical protein [Clostridia bacterium]
TSVLLASSQNFDYGLCPPLRMTHYQTAHLTAATVAYSRAIAFASGESSHPFTSPSLWEA